jgi:O-antigen/teichoic acid export membrane protein
LSANRSIATSALFNLLGGAAPALVTIFTIPYIVHQLGDASYGVLTLITSIIGYFAILDINATAGSVKFVAHHHAKGAERETYETITFGLALYLVIGLTGMAGIYLARDFLVEHIFNVPQALRGQSALALKWGGLGFLLGQMQTYLQSVPQALQRYDISGRVEATFGALVPLATVAVLVAGGGLVEVVIVRVAGSALHAITLCVAIKKMMPNFLLSMPGAQTRQGIMSFSLYSFLSRLAAITYAHADKLLIGAMVGVNQVAYFSVASTLANRVLALTGRLSGVIFPAASAMAARNQDAQLKALYLDSSRYLAFINGVVVLLLAAFAEPILTVWMGKEFASHGATVMSIIAIAQLVDSLTNLPSLVNDGLGHPRVSGFFAISRALLGLALLAGLILAIGTSGAAWGHLVASVVMTTAFVAYVHGRTVPVALAEWLALSLRPAFTALLLATLVALVLRYLISPTWPGLIGASAVTLCVSIYFGWRFLVSAQHKQLATLKLLNRVRRRS